MKTIGMRTLPSKIPAKKRIRTDLVHAYMLLLYDDEAEVHTAAAGQLTMFFRIVSPELLVRHIAPCIEEYFSSDAPQHVRSAALSIIGAMNPLLGKLRPQELIEAVTVGLQCENVLVRWICCQRLSIVAGLLGEKRTREELLLILIQEILDDDEEEVLLVVAEQLGGFIPYVGGIEHAAVLIPFLESLCIADKSSVRNKVVESLCIIGSQMIETDFINSFIPLLKRLATVSNLGHVARASSIGLFQIAYQNAPEHLRNELIIMYSQLCQDDMPMVRRAAATNLGKFAVSMIMAPFLAMADDSLIELYHEFITDFEIKSNFLKLAHFAVNASQQYSEKEAAIGYLEGVVEILLNAKDIRIEESILYIKLQIALFELAKGDQKDCKKLLEQGKTTLDSMTDIDPSVYASYYWVSSQYHKARQEFAEFYISALRYLAYTSVDSLSEPFKLDLAFDLFLSALLGDNVYNFSELLAHPIIKNVIGSKGEWQYYILEALTTGDLDRYQDLCDIHQTALSAQPALVQNEKKLLEKINILSLMEIIVSRSAEDRTIPLSAIAEHTKLNVEDIEYLLMKSLSVHLMEGTIDQVEGTVLVSWVQPRFLGIPQVQSLRDRVDHLVDKVHTLSLFMEAETRDFS
ncbi:PREDICTED: 26S proteasome non-ATPase regulatory subunit 13 homolog B-like isoform X2 [Nicotiana attenuata]|uniref:26S proteasome non-ATPase regulatory subunit 13 homolog B-like isoform X2 n=1 Tax=Nicotiana attenuata TaxID=49451 RepID=UPI000904A7F3|nr:PREDICTED: 26S proteasome non-ATPase regulatory subunit 13 homolog B-like isoform X2 [Nicotiana attenuata]